MTFGLSNGCASRHGMVSMTPRHARAASLVSFDTIAKPPVVNIGSMFQTL